MTTRKAVPIKEKQIENSILSYLKTRGVFAFKVESTGLFDPTLGRFRRKNSVHRMVGVSDILGILPGGRFFAIEVKSKVGRLSEHQKKFLASVNEVGGIGFVARSIDDVEARLGLA